MMYDVYFEWMKIFEDKMIEPIKLSVDLLIESINQIVDLNKSDIILCDFKLNKDMLVDRIDSMLSASSLEINPLNVLSCNFQNYELISNDTDENKIDIFVKFENLSTVKPYATFPKKFDFECKYRKLLGLCDEKTYQIHIDKMITNNTDYINTNKNTILHTTQNNFMRPKMNIDFWIYNHQIGA